MGTKSTNLLMNKPYTSDVYDLDLFNENTDILDTEIKSLKDSVRTKATSEEAKAGTDDVKYITPKTLVEVSDSLVEEIIVETTGVQSATFNLTPGINEYRATGSFRHTGSVNADFRVFLNTFSSTNMQGQRLVLKDGTVTSVSPASSTMMVVLPGSTIFFEATLKFDKRSLIPFISAVVTDGVANTTHYTGRLTTYNLDYLQTIQFSLISSDYPTQSNFQLYKL